MDLQCRYIYWKGPKKGSRCPHRPRGSEYCYQHRETAEALSHRENRAVVLNEDPIFNGAGQAPKPAAVERTSIYHWTINSNQPYEKMTPEDKKKFKKYIEDLMTNDKILDYVTDKNAPDHRNIDNVKTDYYFEVSPTAGLLHAHGYVSIKHRGFITLRLNQLRADAQKLFGKNLHFHWPVSSDSEATWAAYIAKNSASNKLNLE